VTRKGWLLTVGTCTIATTVLCGQPAAQDRQVYRYVDAEGRVVYSDRVPATGAKEVQRKRVTANTITTSELPIVVQQATERYPVTLFTFACGAACENGQALLNRRGVPYTTVAVDDAEGQQKLQAVAGELAAPVLQVGDKLVAKGFSETRWNALLDQAGYPKTPATRTAQARSLGGPVEPQPVPPAATPAR
jgi:hypothetical protein